MDSTVGDHRRDSELELVSSSRNNSVEAKLINAKSAFKFFEVDAKVAARAVNDEQFALAA